MEEEHQPQVCMQLLEAGSGKNNLVLPRGTGREYDTPDTMILGHWDSFWTSDNPKFKIKQLCYFKPQILW